MSHADQTQAETYCCLDAGCGEGYYLRQLAHNVPESQALSLLGLDISKWAVQSAAKQDDKQAPICRWVVGSNAQLPVQSASVDSVLCMFGFPVYSEFARVLKTGGQLIQVDAGPQHLRELRDIIYPTLKPTREKETNVPEGFARRASEQICYAISLEGGRRYPRFADHDATFVSCQCGGARKSGCFRSADAHNRCPAHCMGEGLTYKRKKGPPRRAFLLNRSPRGQRF